MSRDYAKKMPHATRRTKQRRQRRWIVLLLSLALLAILSLGFKQCHSRFPLFSAPVPSQAEVNAQFDFYPDGQSAQSKSPPPLVATHPSAAPPPIEKKTAVGRYILQLGTFQSENEASEMRVSLLLAGWDVNVVRGTVAGHVQYHVQQGPYNTLESAKAAQKILESQGLMSVIKE